MKKAELPKGITLRKDGLYMARFAYEGQRYTFYNKNLKKLQKEMNEKRYEIEHGMYCKETKTTVEEWFKIWIKDYKENTVKRGTVEAYKDTFKTYIKREIGKKRLSSVKPEDIQKIYNDMAEKYKRSTINLVSVVLSGMYKQAVKCGIVNKNPVQMATLPRDKSIKEIRVLSLEEQRLFLQYARQSEYYALYVVALNTGMRLGELRGLFWKNIDFEKNVIHVRYTMRYHAESGTIVDTPKTKTSIRDIPILDEVMRTLCIHRKEQMVRRLLLGEKWKADFDDLVFTSPFGKHVNATAINKDMRSIENSIREAGHPFEHIYPHVLRHTFATRGLERGIPPKIMQELLGHTSIVMTLDIYSHVLPDVKAEQLKKIENLYDSASGVKVV